MIIKINTEGKNKIPAKFQSQMVITISYNIKIFIDILDSILILNNNANPNNIAHNITL